MSNEPTIPEFEEIVEARYVLDRIILAIENGLLGYVGPELEPDLRVVEPEGEPA